MAKGLRKGITYMSYPTELVIVSGMSGAGKTEAIKSFEDMGFYVVDNLPPSMFGAFLDLVNNSEKITKVALGIDTRTYEFLDTVDEIHDILREDSNQSITTLFLEAKDEELVSRFKETRRSHPLADQGSLLSEIRRERQVLSNLRTGAQHIIDTTDLTPRQLRERLMRLWTEEENPIFTVNLMSFGFKFGAPIDADITMDVRFLPNPHYIPELQPQTGLDQPVYDYVMKQEVTEEFYQKFTDLIYFTLPSYEAEGKSTLTIGIGCTGGKHRSVALVERLGKDLKAKGYKLNVIHRDRPTTENELKHHEK